jgi:hypothetical protein
MSSSPSQVSAVSGRPIHPPDRFEATREKSPNRVEGGKKAASSRGLEVHESPDQQPKVDSDSIPTTDRYGDDLLGPDFHPGKNPTRQEVSRRIARERGHEAFVEMGKKGGSTQAGIHAGQMNKLDADDYQTYLEHPEVGVPEKNPNRVVGGKKAAATRGNEVHGDPKVGPFAGGNTRGNTRDPSQKDPVRVEAGKKAARARGFHVRDDDEQENQNESENEEMEDEDEGRGRQFENEQNEIQPTSKNPNRVRGGKQAARTKGQHVHDEDENETAELSDTTKDPTRVQAGKKAASHFSREHFVEMGKKGAEARIQKYHLHRHPSEEEEQSMEEGDENEIKHRHRSEGAKKAASRTKGQHEDENERGELSDTTKDPTRVQAGKKAASHFSHEHFVELGKKGAAARIAKYHQHRHAGPQAQNFESENESENEGGSYRENEVQSHPDVSDHGKNPRRVEASRKGSSAVIAKYGFNRRGPSGRGSGGGSIQRSSSSSPTYRGRTRGGSSRSAESANEDENESFEDQSERPSRRRSSAGSTSRRGGGKGGSRPDDEDVSDEDYDDSRASRESIYTHSGFPLSVAGTRDDGRSGARVRGGQLAAIKRGLSVERGEEEMTSKNPNRMMGAKRAASQRSHQDFVEMGKKGGRARWNAQTEDEEHSMEEGEDHQKNPHRVQGGRKAASHFPREHFVEMGKKGAAARIEKYHLQRHPSEEKDQTMEEGDEDEIKRRHRSEGAKKAASHFSHEHFVEMGKKGAAARIAKYHQHRRGPQSQNFESENESENEFESHPDVSGDGKNPRRAEAGRKGAASRWGKDSSSDQQDDKDRFDYGEESSKQTGRYRSKREADTNIESPSKRTRHLVY